MATKKGRQRDRERKGWNIPAHNKRARSVQALTRFQQNMFIAKYT
jgi:hypothetical protein